MNKDIIIINLLGGPGVGKSTLASYIFYNLKKLGYTTELVTEYAKDIIWEENYNILDNQLYIFANQHHKVWRIINTFIKKQIRKGIIITDSPLILSSVYYKGKDEKFINFIIEYSNKILDNTKNNYNILNLYYFIKRNTKFEQFGRKETLNESKKIDEKIIEVLKKYDIKYEIIDTLENEKDILYEILKKIEIHNEEQN